MQVKFEDGEEEAVDAQHLREPEVIRKKLERQTKRLKKQDTKKIRWYLRPLRWGIG